MKSDLVIWMQMGIYKQKAIKTFTCLQNSIMTLKDVWRIYYRLTLVNDHIIRSLGMCYPLIQLIRETSMINLC